MYRDISGQESASIRILSYRTISRAIHIALIGETICVSYSEAALPEKR
jgi:hypothetical protein